MHNTWPPTVSRTQTVQVAEVSHTRAAHRTCEDSGRKRGIGWIGSEPGSRRRFGRSGRRIHCDDGGARVERGRARVGDKPTLAEEARWRDGAMDESIRKRIEVLHDHLRASCDGNDESVHQRLDVQAVPTRAPSEKDTILLEDTRTGKKYSIPILKGNVIRAVDLKQVKGHDKEDAGLKTYDPGYVNTAPVRSTISFIDGDKGILRYRGIPIEVLAEKSTFMEVTYLLAFGGLPTIAELTQWEATVMRHTLLPLPVTNAINQLPMDVHPMVVMVTGMAMLGGLHPEANPAIAGQGVYKDRVLRTKQIVRALGKATALAAAAYHRSTGRTPAPPRRDLSYAENFLYMIDAHSGGWDYRPDKRIAHALDVMMILHAEHEMNCSTAAARHIASGGADVYTCLSAAIGALYGPLHGGANEAVLRMLERIGSLDKVPAFLEGVKSRKEKLFGFGHRVYKNFDPRAKIIRGLADEVFSIVGKDPLIDVAVALESAALSDEYFVSRKLYPNVDFYSGLVYRALGFPPQFFTVLFAVPRVAGYLAHWSESLDDPDTRIIRPQQVYEGPMLQPYIPIQQRDKGNAPSMPAIEPSNASRRLLTGFSAS